MSNTGLRGETPTAFEFFKEQISAQEVSKATVEATNDIFKRIWEWVSTGELGELTKRLNQPLASFYIEGIGETLMKERSAGNVTIIFAHAILSLIGDAVVVSPELKEVIHRLCKMAEQRPFPTLYWARFVESHLDDPQLLKYVLTGCKRNKSLLAKNIQSVTEQYREQIFPENIREILVFGYSETILSALTSFFANKKTNIELFTPRLLLPKREQAEGELLRDRLEKKKISINVLDDNQALDKLKNAGIGLLLMGSKVVASTSEGNLEVVSCRGGAEFSILAHEVGIPVGIVTGGYKVWPTDIYEKNRGLLKLESSGAEAVDSIVPAHLVSWIMTEHKVFSPEEFRQFYDVWFDYAGLPLGSIVEPLYPSSDNLKYLKSQIKNMYKEIGLMEDIDRIAYRFVELLDFIEPGGHLKIVAGHANRKFYERVEEALRDLKINKQRDLPVSIVAGPILSVDENNDSPLLRLGRDGIAKLYISRMRQRRHFRILGNKIVQVEGYHTPLQSEREVKQLNDVYSIAKYLVDFDGIVNYFCSPWDDKNNGFIKLKDADLAKLELHPWSWNDDFLDRQKLYEKIQKFQ